jgi:hypothetical protein
MIVASGHGYHAYWQFKEAIDAAPGKAQGDFEEALKLLCAYVGADGGTCDASRLLRLPGSHNTKNGDKLPVEIINYDNNRTYELSDLVDFLLDAQPIMPVPLKPKANGHDHDASYNSDGPIDVDGRLAAMTFGATDGTGINETYKSVSPLLLSQGQPWDEIETLWVDAVMAAGIRAGQTWSRGVEIKNTRERFRSTLRNLLLKDYDYRTGEIPAWLPVDAQDRWAEIIREGGRPDIGENHYGLYVRKMQGSSSEEVPAKQNKVLPEAKDLRVTPTSQRLRFPLLDFSDMVPTDEDPYLIESLFPRHGLLVIWGKMKTFKSTWSLDAFLHVARNRPYRGLKVQGGRVVYCVFEGSHGYRNRITALRLHYEIPQDEIVPLHIMSASINLIKDHNLLIKEIKDQLAARGVTDMPIAIVLDTLNRSLSGSESKDEDMSNYIKAADKLREEFNALVAIVHHCGHTEDRPRGHSSLSGAIDGQIRIERPERGSTMTAEVELMRDGPEGHVIRSIVKTVDVHTLPDGRVKTSPILLPDEAGEGFARLPKEMKNPRGAKFRQALREALAQHGIIFQPDRGALPVSGVDQEKVRERFYELYNDGKTTPDAKLKSYGRALADAQKSRYVDSRTDLKTNITMIWQCYDEGVDGVD